MYTVHLYFHTVTEPQEPIRPDSEKNHQIRRPDSESDHVKDKAAENTPE